MVSSEMASQQASALSARRKHNGRRKPEETLLMFTQPDRITNAQKPKMSWGKRVGMGFLACGTAVAAPFMTACGTGNAIPDNTPTIVNTDGVPNVTPTETNSSTTGNLGDSGGEIVDPFARIMFYDNPNYAAGCLEDGGKLGTAVDGISCSIPNSDAWIKGDHSYTPHKADLDYRKFPSTRVDCVTDAVAGAYAPSALDPRVGGQLSHNANNTIWTYSNGSARDWEFHTPQGETPGQDMQGTCFLFDATGVTNTSSGNTGSSSNEQAPSGAESIFANAGVPDGLAQQVIADYGMDNLPAAVLASITIEQLPKGACAALSSDDKAWRLSADGSASDPLTLVLVAEASGAQYYETDFEDLQCTW